VDFSKSIKFFYKNIIDTSLGDVLEGDLELLIATATLIHEHNKR
jgi:hypothetical protein